MKLNKKFVTVFAAVVLLVQSALPAFAATTIVVSGNGADSKNQTDVSVSQTTNVVQSNNANVTNQVKANANTGGNKANKNTGGDVAVHTGDASVDTKISNTLNTNAASVDCCNKGDVDVKISGNGADSRNNVDLSVSNSTLVSQTNNANVKNNVDAYAGTGYNESNKNTGGDSVIRTGDASVTTEVSTSANANSARVGANGNGAKTLSAWVVGNGADSRNDLDLDFGHDLNVVQNNSASVYNKVDVDAGTGSNKANKNTGGDFVIETGDATVDVVVDTMTNFNWADVDCGCLFDVLAKIHGNGYDSRNDIEAVFDDSLGVFQSNGGYGVDNLVYADAGTGYNESKKGTGYDGSDPYIKTGDAESYVEVTNGGNSNVYGETPEWEFPMYGFNLNISFNLRDLLEFLMG
ncbi:MAG: hypothetical protein N2558_00805 [Patescibacteria group bacterium]|nr:hypothetical protein [Patescibacteria group bacterium]